MTAQAGDYMAAQLSNAVGNNSANTYSGGGLQDFSADNIKIPAAAGFPATASNNFGYDTTNTNVHVWDGTGTGAQARISAVALANNGFQGIMMWDAFNVTAGSDKITVTTATSQLSYTGISVVELSGTNTLDGSSASTSSFTSTANLTTTQSADVVVCTARGESLSNGWTAGNIAGGAATIPANGVTTSNSVIATEYRKLSGVVRQPGGRKHHSNCRIWLGPEPRRANSVSWLHGRRVT